MSDPVDDIRAFLARTRAAAAAGSARAAAAVAPLEELHARRGLPEPGPARWDWARLAGRLVEVSALGAAASLTATIAIALDAQLAGDPVAWVCLPGSSFFPPDLADAGLDLDALVVVRAPSPEAAGRAADRLLRCGGFGLVVLDLCDAGAAAMLPQPLQGRLVGLAQRHDAALICVTGKPAEAASLGSMVSLRAEALRRRHGDGAHEVVVRAVKDKQRGPGWEHAEPARGPAGM